jgi:hypothetical protein
LEVDTIWPGHFRRVIPRKIVSMDQKIVGAVSVSGGTSTQDGACANAGGCGREVV